METKRSFDAAEREAAHYVRDINYAQFQVLILAAIAGSLPTRVPCPKQGRERTGHQSMAHHGEGEVRFTVANRTI